MSKHDFSTLALPYKKGEWYDADYRMFDACFAILGQFVEGELGPAEDPAGLASGVYRGYRLHSGDEEAIDLWLWYRDELPRLQKDYDDDIAECFSGGLITRPSKDCPSCTEIVSFGQVRETKYPYDWPETVREEKLAALMRIRRSLWT